MIATPDAAPTPAPGTPVLTASGVAKRYSRRRPPALDGVDLEVRAGTITALVGPNGAGKSTLIKAWAGFERPSRGTVAVLGINPFRDRYGAQRNVGYVPQSPTLYRDLRVDEHLTLAATLRRSFDRDLARRRLDDLSIPLDAQAGRLSGGQQAQVQLAIAIGTRAPVLLLDEPLAGLDPLARREFLYILEAAVREHGTTALLSSHNVSDVEQACTRLVVLGGGRKLLDEDVATAVAAHRVFAGDAPVLAKGRAVASYLDQKGGILTLLELDGEDPALPTRPATLEDVMLGYLAAGRPGMLDRVRAGIAGR
jgi:ABC-2 type transport system ATP-binding protein